MEILIDESGTFTVKGASKNSWCVVLAYVCPESEKTKYKKILANLKRTYNIQKNDEIKLNQISENDYINFLKDLNTLESILLCVATDSGLNSEHLVKQHKKILSARLRKNINEMKYETGKAGAKSLTDKVENLSDQLYIQLRCQILLMESFVHSGINYFVQRNPNSLKQFRWRVDQKSPDKKKYETAFEILSPVLLQSNSIENPGYLLNWCDYEPMSPYIVQKGELPKYLIDKFPHLKDKGGFNIQKIVRNDIQFLDSLSHPGIQIADLLASGLRRLLRLGFKNNMLVAQSIGALMVQGSNNKPPIKFSGFGEEFNLDHSLTKVVAEMNKSCRRMVKKG